MFACVTLLRSPVVGAKSDAGKKLARNLQDLLRTLLEKDMPATPEHDQLPRDHVLKLCKDSEDAALSSVCSGSGSQGELRQRAGSSSTDRLSQL